MMGDSLPSNHQNGFCPPHGTEIAKTTLLALDNGLLKVKRR
jgi:hypothetical protein